jgi:hypothetical protein
VVEHECFSLVCETLEIEPNQTKALEVVYRPLEMTSDIVRHDGSVFIPLPDGNGLMWRLVGQADKPIPENTIVREISSKVPHSELLKVPNWLKRPQRFRVTFELAKPDSSISIKGNEFVDVAGLSSKDYRLQLYAYREGTYTVKAIFKNEASQEYLYYVINLKTTAAGILETIDLVTPVRREITREITISNPLMTPVSFTTSVGSTDVTVPHSLTIQPRFVIFSSLMFF